MVELMIGRTLCWTLAWVVMLPNPFWACGAEPVSAGEAMTPAKSQWVSLTAQGELAYKTLPAGDRIMDFSYAGYGGGGVALPDVPVKAVVAASGGDDTTSIQEALNTVARAEMVNGFRGAVLLRAGTFTCSRPLTLNASGVVLRGSGSGTNGTTIRMTGAPHVCLTVSDPTGAEHLGEPVRITAAYVPSGTRWLEVEDASGFRPGDSVLVTRPVTAAWLQFMNMDGLVRNGRRETWLGEGSRIFMERRVETVAGHRVGLDLPLSDALDAKYLEPPGATLQKLTPPQRLSQVGLEHLRIVCPPQPVAISQRHHQAIRMDGVMDGWVRDLAIEDTVNSVSVGSGARRITLENVRVQHTVATKGSAKPADFSAGGTQILLDRCSVAGDNLFYFVTGPRVTGPNVVLHCTFQGNGHLQPHARWATGLLVDNCEVLDGGIDFMNRGEMGSGHGWTMGWGVAWNCAARSYVIQQPPGAANWAIGCRGGRQTSGMPFGHEPKLPEGIFDSHNTPVAPASLYLAQLRARLGGAALQAIGY